MRSFCIAKASHIFSTKNISVFDHEDVKHLMSWPLNELVKLTMLWTTGPWWHKRKKPHMSLLGISLAGWMMTWWSNILFNSISVLQGWWDIYMSCSNDWAKQMLKFNAEWGSPRVSLWRYSYFDKCSKFIIALADEVCSGVYSYFADLPVLLFIHLSFCPSACALSLPSFALNGDDTGEGEALLTSCDTGIWEPILLCFCKC